MRMVVPSQEPGHHVLTVDAQNITCMALDLANQLACIDIASVFGLSGGIASVFGVVSEDTSNTICITRIEDIWEVGTLP